MGRKRDFHRQLNVINHHIFIGRSDCGTVGDCLVHDYRRILVLGLEMFLDILMVNRVVIVSIVVTPRQMLFLLLDGRQHIQFPPSLRC